MSSVNEALYYKVPMVVVPMVDDELAVGEGIVDLELGTGPQEGQRADARACCLDDSCRQTNRRQCQQDQRGHAKVRHQRANSQRSGPYPQPPLINTALTDCCTSASCLALQDVG